MEKIVILDFGSQTTQLIARRIRECNVYSEIVPYNIPADELKDNDIKGIILSGGPATVGDSGEIRCERGIFHTNIPVLGICYGMQLIAQHFGGKWVSAGSNREYGSATLDIGGRKPFDRSNVGGSELFRDCNTMAVVWMSHGDEITELPEDFKTIAGTEKNNIAAIEHKTKPVFGVQFHPEVSHTYYGTKILSNFVDVCGCERKWTTQNIIKDISYDISEKVDNRKVLCAVSGGVDSAVTAVLLNQMVTNVKYLFIDTGLNRKNEEESIRLLKLVLYNSREIIEINAKDDFLKALKGISDPERKRKVIGETFIRVFTEIVKNRPEFKGCEVLAQGTLYPDVIESTPVAGPSKVIKTHHNVGGLPDELGFNLVEPLRMLFKDEVRAIGQSLGLPPEIINRHPSPGPCLGVRALGEITEKRLIILRDADAIFIEELKKANLYDKVAQAFCVLLNDKAVGVRADCRSYGYILIIRSVNTNDFMTADWSRLPNDFLALVSNKIMNALPEVGHVAYSISSKPPATIELE